MTRRNLFALLGAAFYRPTDPFVNFDRFIRGKWAPSNHLTTIEVPNELSFYQPTSSPLILLMDQLSQQRSSRRGNLNSSKFSNRG